jgi:hypothetical protein
VTFKPSGTSNEVAGLTVSNSGEGGPVFINLTGTTQVSYYGFPVLNPSTVNFPTTPEGYPSQVSVSMTNDGNQPWQFSGFTPSGANPADFILDPSTCAGPLQPGQPCQMLVYFIPLAQGYRSATITIQGLSDSVPMPATLTLNGNSVNGTPLIDLLAPQSVLSSNAAAGFTFTLQGAGFNATSKIFLNGQPLATSFPQNTLQSMQATVPAGVKGAAPTRRCPTITKDTLRSLTILATMKCYGEVPVDLLGNNANVSLGVQKQMSQRNSTPSHDGSSHGTPGRRVFEGALIWSVVGLSIALLLIVLAGTAQLLPASLVVACRLTLTYLCAVLTLVAVGYTAIDAVRSRAGS